MATLTKIDWLEDRIRALEERVDDLQHNLESTNNELAYVDAYQENLQLDVEELQDYVEDTSASLFDLEDRLGVHDE